MAMEKIKEKVAEKKIQIDRNEVRYSPRRVDEITVQLHKHTGSWS